MLLTGNADGVVRAVNTRTGKLTTPGESGTPTMPSRDYPGPAADGSPARSAHFYLSCDAATDRDGNLVLSDSFFLTGNETQTGGDIRGVLRAVDDRRQHLNDPGQRAGLVLR
jgi:hypothetical protein